MKVAVSSTGNSLDSQVDPRFGRCPYFLIVDTDTMQFEIIENRSAFEVSGAGIQAAQNIVLKGVQVVITGNVGPNAYQVLSSAGVRVLTEAYGTVKEAIEKFKRGELVESFGSGLRGGGRGRGYGMSVGRGRGLATNQSPPSSINPSIDEEIKVLEDRMKVLQKQLDDVRQKLDRLKSEKSTKAGGDSVG
ncbi:MAG: NifB/NifX family molybdenum-iron cluster-binding protein [Nitrososphaeria archaeon]